MGGYHTPVLFHEALESLRCRGGGIYVDGTVGGGGHGGGILKASEPDGRLIGIDRDDDALREAGRRLAGYGDRVTLVKGNFADLDYILRILGIDRVDGILLDLGVSNHQLTSPERGFGFSADGPLDMRMDREGSLTAAEIVNTYSQERLETLIREWGEERMARRIARLIVAKRRLAPLRTTGELARIVAEAVGGRRGGAIHPATRTFQALRIAVNGELDNLQRVIPVGTERLKPGGRFTIIAFHSLEDRIVKRGFLSLTGICSCPPGAPVCCCPREGKLRIINRRPIRPGEDEVAANPAARSARLRTAERI
ncbi:MAG: 16S rRNA (cytosine(1402)-N(4))-methyltransferase RsmH [Syntrophales bacterium]|nr:16S rRNA (cytosine(1402)-N(4))-methyltransferase RsmH [Syntrophales bacterium]